MSSNEAPLPPGWTIRMERGLALYVHPASGTSTWTRPVAPKTLPQAAAPVVTRLSTSQYDQALRDIARFLSDLDRTTPSSGGGGSGSAEESKQNLLAVTLQSEYDRIRALVARPHLTQLEVNDVNSTLEYMQQQIKQYERAQASKAQPMLRPAAGAVPPDTGSAPTRHRPSLAKTIKKQMEPLDPTVSVVSTYLHARNPAEKARALDRLYAMEREWNEFTALSREMA